jgi:cytidylate kinase
MTTKLSTGGRDLAKIAERQMRNWEIARAQRHERPPAHRPEVEEFICVSRMPGLGGHRVAAEVAERLGWPIFDRELLERMAGDDRLRHQIYASMDQRDLSWGEEILRTLLQTDFVRNDYFHRLCDTVLSLGRQGHSVFLGRGADLILPRDRGLRVRLVAERATRVAAFAAERSLERDRAAAELTEVENQRNDFLRHHFRVDPESPTRFDLVIHLDHFPVDQAVALIVEAQRLRAGG